MGLEVIIDWFQISGSFIAIFLAYLKVIEFLNNKEKLEFNIYSSSLLYSDDSSSPWGCGFNQIFYFDIVNKGFKAVSISKIILISNNDSFTEIELSMINNISKKIRIESNDRISLELIGRSNFIMENFKEKLKNYKYELKVYTPSRIYRIKDKKIKEKNNYIFSEKEKLK